jgi:hemerythrin
VVDNAHRELVEQLDEIVQLWRMGAETPILGERLQAFRDHAEAYFQQKISVLAGSTDSEFSRHMSEHADMIHKIDGVLADFSAGGGAVRWFDMVDSVRNFLRHHESGDAKGDCALLNERIEPTKETLIGWTRELSVGVDWVDQHHRALIDTINEIGMLPKHYDLADADALLERLRRITWYHFHEEEAHLALSDRERAHRHVAQHRFLLAELDRLIFDVRSRRVDLTGETSDYLCRWLVDHIQTIDKDDFQSIRR